MTSDEWGIYDMTIPTFLLFVTAVHGKAVNSEVQGLFFILLHMNKTNDTLKLYFTRFTRTFMNIKSGIQSYHKSPTPPNSIYKTKGDQAMQCETLLLNALRYPSRMLKSERCDKHYARYAEP
jgi:hypothetical protein